MSFDFKNAQTPQLTPLRHSFTVDEIESDLRNLFIDLFDAYLGSDAFDANVLGMAHLGSLGLVRKSVNADGLVFLPGDREEPATRYVYRAWKARNLQGRGLFFLKTYLQALFPSGWEVSQQTQDSALPYPTALHDRWLTENDADKYLTSRLLIKLDATVVSSVSGLVPVISSIIPARFVPKLMIVLHTKSVSQFAAVGGGSITFRCHGTVQPAPSNPPADTLLGAAAVGNPAITLHASGSVSR